MLSNTDALLIISASEILRRASHTLLLPEDLDSIPVGRCRGRLVLLRQRLVKTEFNTFFILSLRQLRLLELVKASFVHFFAAFIDLRLEAQRVEFIANVLFPHLLQLIFFLLILEIEFFMALNG